MTAHTLSDAVSGEARMIPIYNVDTPENKVAITFNCAVGNSDIDSILETLDKYNVKATFFLLGLWVDDYMEEVQNYISNLFNSKKQTSILIHKIYRNN